MLEVSILANKRGLWKFAGRAVVDGQLAAEAELLCTVREIE
jgi:3-hydroxyacyl-[acyl-carrier-protein] dehydratase